MPSLEPAPPSVERGFKLAAPLAPTQWAMLSGAHGRRACADLMRGHIVTAVLTQGIKVAVDRQRPDGSRFSFPSGHTSSTFTTAAVLQHEFGWKIGAPAYVVATFIGGSRLQENRHYLSDVLFGAAIGIVSGLTATAAMTPRNSPCRRLSLLAPSASRLLIEAAPDWKNLTLVWSLRGDA